MAENRLDFGADASSTLVPGTSANTLPIVMTSRQSKAVSTVSTVLSDGDSGGSTILATVLRSGSPPLSSFPAAFASCVRKSSASRQNLILYARRCAGSTGTMTHGAETAPGKTATSNNCERMHAKDRCASGKSTSTSRSYGGYQHANGRLRHPRKVSRSSSQAPGKGRKL